LEPAHPRLIDMQTFILKGPKAPEFGIWLLQAIGKGGYTQLEELTTHPVLIRLYIGALPSRFESEARTILSELAIRYGVQVASDNIALYGPLHLA
jgi:hypothetical protein